MGLVWGGTFTRKDYPHFQLPITLNEAKARWLARGNVAGGGPMPAPVVAAVVALGLLALVFSRGLRVW